ncbi:hypothetical protein ACIBI4_33500 [Streptomyces sp. NPDC050418]|uniref:hypothetical protein n=1 Tax=Streptomyces sp. NPDC050418 TaxID=3365612 RepID=UPI0037B79B69
MSQNIPAATVAAAEQRNLGAHKATHLPERPAGDARRLDEFERGIVAELNNGDLFAASWGKLHVYQLTDGRNLPRSHVFWLHEAGGGRVHLGDWPGDVRSLILQGVWQVWVPWIVNQALEGKPYEFIVDARKPKNNLGVRAEGLHIKGRVWPWTTIRSIEFTAGMFYVKVNGKLSPLAYNIGGVPNAHVLLAASQALHAQAS